MKIYNNLNISKNHKNSVIAIGNFDGIHLGHQQIINTLVKNAKKNDKKPKMHKNRKVNYNLIEHIF